MSSKCDANVCIDSIWQHCECMNRHACASELSVLFKPTMSKEAFLRKLQRIVGHNLPRGLDNIIFEAGFDAESALATINSTSIKNIEEYVNENKNILKETVYEHLITNDLAFKLKPGHKSIILNLPKSLELYEAKKLTGLVPALPNSSTEQEVILKKSLVDKITKFAKKCSFDIIFSESSIFEFRQENGGHKCRFECPFCSKKIRCEHRSYWLVSNFEKHLKIHFAKDLEIVHIDSCQMLATNENQNSVEVISYVADRMNELDDILTE